MTIRAWPPWLLDAPPPAWPLPAWLASVPTPHTRAGRALDEDARARLLAALERGDDSLVRFEAWLDPASLRAHAWALVDAWAANGSDPRHRVVLAGLRSVSDDELEERLVPSREPEAGGASAVLAREIARLERALSTGRDWSVADWRHWLLEHRLMRSVVPKLVWAQRSRTHPNRLSRAFRVDGRGGFVDVEQAPVTLDPRERVCLPHPIELGPQGCAAWGDLVAELELIPPFAQLARPTRKAADLAGDTVRASPGPPTPSATLRVSLHRRGWTPGEPGARMRVRYFSKSFLRFDTFGVLVIEPGLGRDEALHPVLHHVRAAFFLARRPGGLSFETDARIPLAQVAPIALSELLYDLAALAE